jgi:hypothetical protein
MNANEKFSTADGHRLTQINRANESGESGRHLKRVGIRPIRVYSRQFVVPIRVHSRPFAVATILLVTAGMLAQPASAGPFDALKNFFVRPQPQAHVTHHHPVRPKEAKDAPKDAPNDSPSPVAPPVDQQTNDAPIQQHTLNNNNRAGRPEIASAPLF